MHTIRLMTAGLAVAATTAALVAGPTHADKPAGNGASTGTGQIFMVNPVQSSGDQSLTDSKDANTARAGRAVHHRPAAQPRRLRHPVRHVGQHPDHDRHPGVQRHQHVRLHP